MHRCHWRQFPELLRDYQPVKRAGSKDGRFQGSQRCSCQIPAEKRCRRGGLSGKTAGILDSHPLQLRPHFDYIELGEEHAIFEVSIPNSWIGKSIGQIDIRKRYNINIMALKRDGSMNMNISSDTVLTEDATMFVLGNIRDLQRCFHI